MDRIRAPWTALTLTAAAAALAAGCATTPAPVVASSPLPATAAGRQPATTPAGGSTGDSHGGRGGHGGSSSGPAARAALPADFPADVPIPPGALQGSSGSAGRWGVLLLADGPADKVLKTTLDFYVAAGFTADGSASVHRGSYRIVVVAENRDHSNTQTNLVLGVSRT